LWNENDSQVLDTVCKRPTTIRTPGASWVAKIRPNTAMPSALMQICHFRSILSANRVLISGHAG